MRWMEGGMYDIWLPNDRLSVLRDCSSY